MVKIRKVFLDTNFWVRCFIRDSEPEYQATLSVIKLIEDGRLDPFISPIVFLEIGFILSCIYRQGVEKINYYYDTITKIRNITIVNQTNFNHALVWSRHLNLKLADCLIASSVPKNCILVTWNKDFNKIKEVNSKTPEELIKSLKL